MTTYNFWASLNNTIFGPHLLISYEQRSFHSLMSTLQDKICNFDFRASVTQNLGLLNAIYVLQAIKKHENAHIAYQKQLLGEGVVKQGQIDEIHHNISKILSTEYEQVFLLQCISLNRVHDSIAVQLAFFKKNSSTSIFLICNGVFAMEYQSSYFSRFFSTKTTPLCGVIRFEVILWQFYTIALKMHSCAYLSI